MDVEASVKVLGLIPARAGSRRLPKKNMAMVGGQTLVGHAITHARESGVIDHVAVSTDDPEISSLCFAYGCNVVHRPAPLCAPDTEMSAVVGHALHALKAHGHSFDAFAIIQPTSPLRTAQDIKACVELLEANGSDSVVSVCEDHHERSFTLAHANRLRPHKGAVAPNGAVYVMTVEAFERGENWYSGIVYAHIMPRERSIDIDTIVELEQARGIVEK